LFMRLKLKMVILTSVIAISYVVIAFVGLHSLKIASESDNFARIEQLFKSAYSTITQLENLVEKGELEEAKAKSIATLILQQNKYHDSEYVYVTDEQLNFVAAPHDPQLHGTSFNDFKDSNGKSIGKIVSDVTQRTPGKMVTYNWTSERDGEVVGLTSVAQKTEKWGWYIGTGISFKETNQRYWDTAQWLLVLALIIITCISIAIFQFGRKLTAELGAEVSEVVDIVSKISKGNLTDNKLEFHAEPNSILGSLSYMRNALREVVSNMQSVSLSLAEQVKDSEQQSIELDQLTSTLDNETHLTAEAIKDIAHGAEISSVDITETAEMLHVAQTNGESANKLTEISTHTIGKLESQIESTGASVKQLAEEVESIESVLTVIQGVAEQTNLLALNAAIEAARAGDQGRGFAVVADEVRQLAKRTQESTKEIHDMIEKLQAAASEAIKTVEQSMLTSAESVDQAKQTSSAITELLNIISDIAAKSNSIDESSKSQFASANGATDKLALIAEMSQKTTDVARLAHEKSNLIGVSSNQLKEQTDKFIL
jgi:methyl-accepting chemotaxis protein